MREENVRQKTVLVESWIVQMIVTILARNERQTALIHRKASQREAAMHRTMKGVKAATKRV